MEGVNYFEVAKKWGCVAVKLVKLPPSIYLSHKREREIIEEKPKGGNQGLATKRLVKGVDYARGRY